MTIKSDYWIQEQVLRNQMITPFFPDSVSKLERDHKTPVSSFGLSSYGYDLRLGRNFKFYKQVEQEMQVYDGMKHAFGESVAQYSNKYMAFKQAFIAISNGVRTRHEVEIIDYDEAAEIDPCNLNQSLYQEIKDCDQIVMPPNSFCLSVGMERIKVPRDVSVTCMGKSTVARGGVIVTVTPLEAAWEGYITLEIANTTGLPVKLTAGMGITQLQFFQSDEQCKVSYADRSGKYQNQPAVAVPPRPL